MLQYVMLLTIFFVLDAFEASLPRALFSVLFNHRQSSASFRSRQMWRGRESQTKQILVQHGDSVDFKSILFR